MAPRTSYELFRNDTDTVLETFMPGYHFNVGNGVRTCLFVVLASAWFVVFFLQIYTSDRAEGLEHWQKRLTDRRNSITYSTLVEDKKIEKSGDFVLVFHHPDHIKHTDRDKEVDLTSIERCFMSHSVTAFPPNLARELGCSEFAKPQSLTQRLAALSPRPFRASLVPADDNSKAAEASARAFRGSLTGDEKTPKGRQFDESGLSPFVEANKEPSAGPTSSASSSADSEELSPRTVRKMTENDGHLDRKVTYHTARFAFMQDVYTYLQEWGFDVQVFSSVDDDELFMVIGLEREEVLEHYMVKRNLRFQLQPELVKKLGIDHPKHEPASSPPAMTYNPSDVEMLKQANIITYDSREMYKVGFGNRRGKHTSIVPSVDRIKCILKELSTVFDLGAAQQQGFLVDHYPAHENRKRLNKIYDIWAAPGLLTDLSLVQPISKIANYFGTRIAFNFAWNGTYCKCLLALLPVAAFTSLAIQALTLAGHPAVGLSSRRVLGFSIVLAIWSRLAHNMWLRESGFFRVLFDSDAKLEKDGQSDVCPHFHGFPEPSPVDLGKMEMQYPRKLAKARKALSYFITLLYSFCVGSIVTAFIHRSVASNGGMLSIWANLFLVAGFKIFREIYNYLAKKLTLWENHKYHNDHYNSHLWKQIFFQFVNYYVPFFYLVVHQRMSEDGCPKEGCLAALQQALNSTLLVLGMFRLTEYTFYACSVKYTLQSELNNLDGEQVHSFLEAQAKYPKFLLDEQIETMVELVLALGFVLIFGAVAFGTVLFCFLVFFIQLRASAYHLTTNARRPLPRWSQGIGAWEGVVELMMSIGILFEGFLIVTFDSSFSGAEPITKLMGIVVFWFIVAFTWFLVDLCCPARDSETELLDRRRKYTVKKFMRKTGHLLSAMKGNYGWAVEHKLPRDACSKIPHFDGSPSTHESSSGYLERHAGAASFEGDK